MSVEVVRQVIARAAAEQEFRVQLFANPAVALAPYGLTSEEQAALSHLSAEGFDQALAALEARVSQAVFNLEAQPTGFEPTEAQPTGFEPLEAQPLGFPPVQVQPSGF